MVGTCSSFAQNKFEIIINRDFGSLSNDYDSNNDLWYIISDYKIFSEVYNFCKINCSNESVNSYFGITDYETIQQFLNNWSIQMKNITIN